MELRKEIASIAAVSSLHKKKLPCGGTFLNDQSYRTSPVTAINNCEQSRCRDCAWLDARTAVQQIRDDD